LTDTPDARAVIGKYVEVYEYPDGRIEVRANGSALPYTIYDRLSEVDQGAVVENKRLGHILQMAQLVQEQRDSRRGRSAPARTNQGLASVKLKAASGKKSQRALSADDLALAIVKTNAKRVVGRSEE
jgi:hypothetical protein